MTEVHVAPVFAVLITQLGFPPESKTAAPPKNACAPPLGSTLTTLSYQHCIRQMSGAVVCVQEVPPFVVTKTPRFVLDPLEESEIEAYTVLSVANCGEIPRSMRPTFDVGSPPDSRENVSEQLVAFVDS